jgi:hypothetical protein
MSHSQAPTVADLLIASALLCTSNEVVLKNLATGFQATQWKIIRLPFHPLSIRSYRRWKLPTNFHSSLGSTKEKLGRLPDDEILPFITSDWPCWESCGRWLVQRSQESQCDCAQNDRPFTRLSERPTGTRDAPKIQRKGFGWVQTTKKGRESVRKWAAVVARPGFVEMRGKTTRNKE